MEKPKCDCPTKYCKHYESDFDRFVKAHSCENNTESNMCEAHCRVCEKRIDELECDCPDKTCDGKHPKNCPTELPSNSLEDKIIQDFYEKFSFIQAVKNEKSGNAYTRISDWLKFQLSLYRQQLLQQYDNMKGSKFRMGYEAGRKECLEKIEKNTREYFEPDIVNFTYGKGKEDQYKKMREIIKNINNK